MTATTASVSNKPRKDKTRYSGHETRLAYWVKEGRDVCLKLNNGQFVNCRIVSYDRYTITVQPELTHGRDHQEVIFKHAIASMTVNHLA